MERKWYIIIVVTVITLFLWTLWGVYTSFRDEKDVGQYRVYVQTISDELDVKFIQDVDNLQKQILVTEAEIAPEGSN